MFSPRLFNPSLLHESFLFSSSRFSSSLATGKPRPIKIKGLQMQKNRVVLIDIMPLVFRSFHGVQSDPVAFGADRQRVYALIRQATSIISTLKPTHLGFAFDSCSSWRKEFRSAYKANRPPLNTHIRDQMPYFRKAISIYNGVCLEENKMEADDLIAAIALKTCTLPETSTTIVSFDKDFVQLLQPNVHIFHPKTKDFITENEVHTKFGVDISQFVDYQALVGDPVDGWKGISGIGPKTAQKLLKEHHNLDTVLGFLEKNNKFNVDRNEIHAWSSMLRLGERVSFDWVKEEINNSTTNNVEPQAVLDSLLWKRANEDTLQDFRAETKIGVKFPEFFYEDYIDNGEDSEDF